MFLPPSTGRDKQVSAMQTMKRWGMISCGLERAARAGNLGTCVYMRWDRWRLKLRSRRLLFFFTTPHCWTKLTERPKSPVGSNTQFPGWRDWRVLVQKPAISWLKPPLPLESALWQRCGFTRRPVPMATTSVITTCLSRLSWTMFPRTPLLL